MCMQCPYLAKFATRPAGIVRSENHLPSLNSTRPAYLERRKTTQNQTSNLFNRYIQCLYKSVKSMTSSSESSLPSDSGSSLEEEHESSHLVRLALWRPLVKSGFLFREEAIHLSMALLGIKVFFNVRWQHLHCHQIVQGACLQLVSDFSLDYFHVAEGSFILWRAQCIARMRENVWISMQMSKNSVYLHNWYCR